MTDTGPPYPRPPAAGSNGIGEFVIGVSPIGDISSFDVWATVISQYANSPILTRLIENIAAYVDPTKNLNAFYDLIWNVQTAIDYGLDVWGRIVGVRRILQVQTGDWFGFGEALPGASPFSQASFYSGTPLTSNYSLSDESYRLLIMAKAAANITDGSIAAINRILMSLFPNRGNCYVQDGQFAGDWFGFAESTNAKTFGEAPFYSGATITTMTMAYVFEFALTPVELAIVEQSGVLPKSTGVAASVIIHA